MRVSTKDQNLALQKDAMALRDIPPSRVFFDVASGRSNTRSGYNKLMETIQPGDTLVVWKVDRLGRDLATLIAAIQYFKENKITLESITQPADISCSSGLLLLHLSAVLAEFESNQLSERVMAGIIAAMARGEKGGIKLTPEMWELAVQMRREPYRSNWQKVRDALVDTSGVEITRHAVYHWRKEIDSGAPYPWPQITDVQKKKVA